MVDLIKKDANGNLLFNKKDFVFYKVWNRNGMDLKAFKLKQKPNVIHVTNLSDFGNGKLEMYITRKCGVQNLRYTLFGKVLYNSIHEDDFFSRKEKIVEF